MGFQRRKRFGFGRPVINQDLEEEFSQHVELLTGELVDRGWDVPAARREARRRFGNEEHYRAACQVIDARRRQKRRRRLEIHGLASDLRYALRRFRQHPMVTAVVLATLALGVGSSVAIFTLVHGVLLTPLPFPDADRLALLWQKDRRHPQQTAVSPPNFYDWRDASTSFETMAAYGPFGVTLTGAGDPERIRSARVTADFFEVLGVGVHLGRGIGPADFDPAPAAVAVLSQGLWQRRFGGRRDVLGRAVQVNGEPKTVIGVMPAGFAFPERETSIWLPSTLPRQGEPVAGSPYRAFRVLSVVGRLADGVPLAEAGSELRAVAARLEEAHPSSNKDQEAVAVALDRHVAGAARPALLVLSGAVALVLLLACTNVAHLLLAQASARDGEMAVRGALGAGSGRLARQLLAESLLLALVGSALGVLVAGALVQLILALAGDTLPRAHEVGIDATVLLVTLGLAVVTGLGFGLVPLLHARRSDLVSTLRSGPRQLGQARVRRAQAGLVIAELALAVPLLVAGGLLAKSFHRLQAVDPGFVAENVWTFDMTLPRRYEEPHQWTAFFNAFYERLEAIPGVTSVGAALQAPIVGHDVDRTPIRLEGEMQGVAGEGRMARHHPVSTTYFETLKIPLVQGRLFDDRDSKGRPAVAVVNETLARLYWPGEDPIGRVLTHEMQLVSDEPTTREVIGVVADVRHFDLASPAEPQLYLPALQTPWFHQAVLIRTPIGASELAAAIRHEVRRLDPDLAVSELLALPDELAHSIGQPRLERWLLVAFASTALFLATIGLYGVMAYSVGQRTHELGLRMALGADGRDVVGLVVKNGMVLVTIGVVLGLLAAAAFCRLLSGRLFEVGPGDLTVYLATLLVTVLVGLAATLVPALRTRLIPPSTALRSL